MKRVIALLVVSPFVACASESPLTEKVQKFQALCREHRLDAAAPMLSAHPRVWYEERSGEGEAWEPSSDRWGEWDDHFRSRSEYRDWKEEGRSVSVTAWETNDFYLLLERGSQPTRLTWFFDEDGRIEGFLVTSRGMGQFPGRRAEFKAWAREHRPEELEYLEPGGRIDPTGDRAPRYRMLLNEWRENVGLEPIL